MWVSALCTKPERGRLRVISRRNHPNIDAAIGAFSPAAHRGSGSSDNAVARDAVVTMGLAGLLNGPILSRPAGDARLADRAG
jgi:hypothetical protein